MTRPDINDLDANCTILEKIAEGYPEESAEREAIRVAAQAMHYVSHVETREKFQSWVDSWTQPPTALQVLHTKLVGIDDLPHELLDETLREVDQLMERLKEKRS